MSDENKLQNTEKNKDLKWEVESNGIRVGRLADLRP